MNSLFKVCTYNLGSSTGDYFQLCKYLDPQLAFKSREEEEQFRKKYDATQHETAKLLQDTADVYCLQEVADTKRPILKTLESKEFQVVRCDQVDIFDSAIVLNTKRFKNITNHSINVSITKHFKKDAAIATAFDIVTGQRVAFVSAHVPGFDFTKNQVDKTEAAEGDLYCRAIANKLNQIGTCAIQIIGADMNANPEKWSARFQTFSQKGFRILRTNGNTNINTKDPIHREREIDFIFTKTITTLWKRIKSIFFSTFSNSSKIIDNKVLGWDPKINASDHLPIFMEVKSNVKNSKIYNLCTWFFNIFSFGKK